MSLSVRMRQVRESQNLTLRDFGKAVGITRDTTYSMERERQAVRGDVLEQIVLKFGVDARWLLTGVGDIYGDGVDVSTPDDVRKFRIMKFVSDWFATKSGDDLVWFEVQLKRCFKEFDV